MAKEKIDLFETIENSSISLENSNNQSSSPDRLSHKRKSSGTSSPVSQSTAKVTNGDDSSVASDSESEDERNNSGVNWANCELDAVTINDLDAIANQNSGNLGLNNSTVPQIGSILVQGSSDITFGNKTFISGQNITINRCGQCEQPSKDDILKNTEINYGLECDGIHHNKQTKSPVPNTTNKDQTSFLGDKFLQNKKTFYLIGITIVAGIIAIILLISFIINTSNQSPEIKTGDGDDSRKTVGINSTIGMDLITGNILRMVERDLWLAEPPRAELTSLKLPVKFVVITHTATDQCETQAACTLRTRFIQTFHIESRGWDDIAYNFLVGGDGAVYEGRGWDKQGAHTRGYNNGIGIAYIGTFNSVLPNDKQLKAGKLLLEDGVKKGKLIENYKLYAHRQLIPSESPGAKFYELIKTWDHWSADSPN